MSGRNSTGTPTRKRPRTYEDDPQCSRFTVLPIPSSVPIIKRDSFEDRSFEGITALMMAEEKAEAARVAEEKAEDGTGDDVGNITGSMASSARLEGVKSLARVPNVPLEGPDDGRNPWRLSVTGHETALVDQLCSDLELFVSECINPGGSYGVEKSGWRKHPLAWRIIKSCLNLAKVVNIALGGREGLASVRPTERRGRARRMAMKLHAYGEDVATVDSLLGVLSSGLAHSVFIGKYLSTAIVDALEFLSSLSDVACGTLCLVCGDLARLVCESCVLVDYCSRRCQKLDWKAGHNLVCGHLRDRVRVSSFDAVRRERKLHVAKSFRRRVWNTVKYFDAANAFLSESHRQ